MSCALANLTSGICADRRPVHGRSVSQPAVAPEQPQFAVAARFGSPPAMPAVHTPRVLEPAVPFGQDAPEATFSLTQLRAAQQPLEGMDPSPAVAVVAASPAVQAPPSFREIRAGRAAAAARVPVAEVRIPMAELESPESLLIDRAVPRVSPGAPCMEQLVERVRRRAAARLQRSH